VAEPTEYLSDPDTPAGLALALREIRSAAAIYLLRVKGFRARRNWRALRASQEDQALGGHGYFLAVAEAFDEFIIHDEQTRKQRAAVRAIHHAYGALSELNLAGQAADGRAGRAFNWSPPTFDVMSPEALGKLIGWSTRAFFWGGDFMLVSVSAKAAGDASARDRGSLVHKNWEALFLATARTVCGEGKCTQETLFDEVQKRLAPEGVILPEFEKVQPRMTEWESADPPRYERHFRRSKDPASPSLAGRRPQRRKRRRA
jgi:hypothetical protein